MRLAFHARERDVNDLLRFLAEQLEVPAAREVTDLFAAIEARAAARPGGFTVALDALDEAFRGHGRRMVDEIVVPLTRRPGVKFLVGTRPGVVDWDLPADRIVNLDHAPTRWPTCGSMRASGCCGWRGRPTTGIRPWLRWWRAWSPA